VAVAVATPERADLPQAIREPHKVIPPLAEAQPEEQFAILPMPIVVATKAGRSSRRSSWVFGAVAVSGVVGLVVAALLAWAVVRVLNPPAPVIPAEKWQLLEVADRVKVLMPGPSQLLMQQGAGMVTKTHMCQLDPDTAYAVSYSDTALPAFLQNPADRLLEDAGNSFTVIAKQQNGDEISRKSIELGPFPGKEIVHRVGKGNSNKLTTRYYLAHGRLYVVMASGKGLDSDHENFRRFFDSFEIIEQP
jgi:hypothetical protein